MRAGIFKRPNDRAPDEDLKKILAQLARLQADQAERDDKRDKRESRQWRWQLAQLAIAVATVAGVIIGYSNLSQGNANLQQQQQTAAQQDQASRYSSISQVELDVDAAIADHPRLISCFEDGQCNAIPPLSSQEMQQAAALATYIVDFYQYLYTQLENLGYAPGSGLFTLRSNVRPGDGNESWITWSETIVNGFKYSSLLCASLKQDASAYEWKFVHAVAVTHVCPNLVDPGPSRYQ